MDPVASLSMAFKPVRQAVIATKDNSVVFANPAALAEFGDKLPKLAADKIFPSEIVDNQSADFTCSATILGKQAVVLVSRQNGLSLHYIDVSRDDEPNLSRIITRRMTSYLRSCINGLKIAADGCFTHLESSGERDDKYVSILYHYYYRIARTVVQIDSADKLKRGEMTFAPSVIDIVKLCSNLAGTIQNLSRDKNVNIVFSTDCGSLLTLADPSLIEVLLLNLFSNSLVSMKDGGLVELGIKQENNKLMISLDDNGSGIPQNKLRELFSIPKDEESAMQPDEGLGLGLFISHEIIKLHKGILLIESREGDGAHIRILLPIDTGDTNPLGTPMAEYSANGISVVLMGLADVLPSNCYGLKYED